MSRVRVLVMAVTLGALVIGCHSGPVRPLPFWQPESEDMTHVVRLPMVTNPRNKLGVAGCPADLRQFGGSWCYSWSANPGCGVAGEYVPMIWDEQHLYDVIGGCSKWLLGPNECDISVQCNRTIDQLVHDWAVIEVRAAALGKWLVLPVFSQRNPEYAGLFWQRFTEVYGRPPIAQAVAVHCYYNRADQCIALVQQHVAFAKQRGLSEVWVTEFFFSEELEARRFVAFLEEEPLVTRYSPFVSRANCAADREYWDCDKGGDPSLFNPDGSLTDKGRWYARPMPEDWRWQPYRLRGRCR